VVGVFFQFTFEHKELFGAWLYAWMSRGAVPLCTENLFLVGNDAWHHQTAFGAVEQGSPSEHSSDWMVYLSNPLEAVSSNHLFTLVSSAPPFMVIPREHVAQRVESVLATGATSGSSCDGITAFRRVTAVGIEALRRQLGLLAAPPWASFDVAGQVGRVASAALVELQQRAEAADEAHKAAGESIKELGEGAAVVGTGGGGGTPQAGWAAAAARPSHDRRRAAAAATGEPSRFQDVVIPFGGLAGVTLFARRCSPAGDALLQLLLPPPPPAQPPAPIPHPATPPPCLRSGSVGDGCGGGGDRGGCGGGPPAAAPAAVPVPVRRVVLDAYGGRESWAVLGCVMPPP
jgi:hypothetical protein